MDKLTAADHLCKIVYRILQFKQIIIDFFAGMKNSSMISSSEFFSDLRQRIISHFLTKIHCYLSWNDKISAAFGRIHVFYSYTIVICNNRFYVLIVTFISLAEMISVRVVFAKAIFIGLCMIPEKLTILVKAPSSSLTLYLIFSAIIYMT